MNLLIINAGSVTVKYKLFDGQLNCLLSGVLDNKNGRYVSSLSKDGQEYDWDLTKEEFSNAAQLILKETSAYSVDKLGFRIVHGGDKFVTPTLLDDNTIKELATISDLAPLHNPPALLKVKQFKELLPQLPMYAVFDTAFHAKMEPKAYLYALPYEYFDMYRIRRYGFHGISHQYVTETVRELDHNLNKIVSCHLGGGASIAAVVNGISVDTSMGFTPLEGLIMATRAGDVDDGAIKYLQDLTKFSDAQVEDIENKKSGLLGISGFTSDMRTLLEEEKKGNERAHLAIEMYIYRIQKYIGSYIAAMDGLDAVVITAGVGCGSDVIRKRIFEKLAYFNLRVADGINAGRINVAENLRINAFGTVPIWIIPTNEELQIAREIKDL
jgi:acetate kinase